MRKTVKFLKYEPARSSAGKDYLRLQTNEGWMSCWEDELATELKKYETKVIDIEIDEKKSISKHTGKEVIYRNILNFYGLGKESDVKIEEEQAKMFDPPKLPKNRVTDNNGKYEKDPTGMAVEIFIHITPSVVGMDNLEKYEKDMDKWMQISVNLVKQARGEFL